MIRDIDEINSIDVDRILGDLALDLIKENIETQVKDPVYYSIDYCEEVFETIDNAYNELAHIEEFKTQLDEIKDTFIIFVLELLNDKFNLDISLENRTSDELKDIMYNCYRVFVIDFREIVENFLLNYVNLNKFSLADMYEDQFKRKDVTTVNIKKMTDSKEDILVISNLPDIVSHILDLEHDPVDFMNLGAEIEEYHASKVMEYLHDFTIAGNFTSAILNELKFTHNDIIDSINSNIRLQLISSLEPMEGSENINSDLLI